jgi:hypothetical protein
MKAEGLGNGAICKQLNAEVIPCPLRYRYLAGLTQNDKYADTIWIISTVAVILRNPLYLGHMTQGKQRKAACEGVERRKTTPDEWIIVPNTHEPIVTQELFDRAGAVLDDRFSYYRQRRNKYPEAEKNKQELILYEAAFCADCGKALARKKTAGGSRSPRWVFRCKKQDDYGACSTKSIRENDLYEAVYCAVRTQVQRYVGVAGVLERLNRGSGYQSQLARLDSGIEEHEKELRRLSSLRGAIYEDYAAKLLTASEYRYATEKYNADIEKQRERLKTVRAERKEYSNHTNHTNKWLATFNRFIKSKSLTREMVQAFVERVDVSSLNRVSVTFKFRDELEALMTEVGT